MDLNHMLDNMATASQSRDLLEPSTRGAVLRSIDQWLISHGFNDAFILIEELRHHPDYSK